MAKTTYEQLSELEKIKFHKASMELILDDRIKEIEEEELEIIGEE